MLRSVGPHVCHALFSILQFYGVTKACVVALKNNSSLFLTDKEPFYLHLQLVCANESASNSLPFLTCSPRLALCFYASSPFPFALPPRFWRGCVASLFVIVYTSFWWHIVLQTRAYAWQLAHVGTCMLYSTSMQIWTCFMTSSLVWLWTYVCVWAFLSCARETWNLFLCYS